MRHRICCLVCSLLLPGVLATSGAEAPHPAEHARKDRATSTHGFEDVEHWVAVFDDPARDAWQKPARIVEALDLQTGDIVADVGAGTGYFNAHWSRAVGEGGAVFAVDVEAHLVAHMRDRAEKEGTANVIPVLGSRDNPRLPPSRTDLAIFVNAYHHIDLRRDYFRRFRRFLAPGGRLVIVDWREDGEIPMGPSPDHRISAGRVVEELSAVGYVPVGSLDFLPYQYGQVLRLGPTAPD